jgi:hypothetical protein
MTMFRVDGTLISYTSCSPVTTMDSTRSHTTSLAILTYR